MKRLSLQWRITLMSVLLIGITCVAMNLLLCSSGVYYMDTIADSSWAALPVNCRWAAKALFSRSSIWLNERLSCRNSEMASSSILISARLFSCTRSTCEAKLRRGLRARPLNNLADMRRPEEHTSELQSR